MPSGWDCPGGLQLQELQGSADGAEAAHEELESIAGHDTEAVARSMEEVTHRESCSAETFANRNS